METGIGSPAYSYRYQGGERGERRKAMETAAMLRADPVISAVAGKR